MVCTVLEQYMVLWSLVEGVLILFIRIFGEQNHAELACDWQREST
jgi:hypothetical protein